jgi:hypothetical protein
VAHPLSKNHKTPPFEVAKLILLFRPKLTTEVPVTKLVQVAPVPG